MKLSHLKKGDIFKFGDKPWDLSHRFHSLKLYEDGRFLINFMGIGFNGNIETAFGNSSFTWIDSDVEVFIPVFYLSEHNKTKGMPCIPNKDQRLIYPSNLNKINLSDVYCSGKDYFHNYYSIIK